MLDDAFFTKKDQLRPEVQAHLMEVYKDVIEDVERRDIDLDPEDFLLIGSMTGPDWDSESDIDLHFLVDFEAYDDIPLAKGFFDEYRGRWNRNDFTMLGRKLEIYFQDVKENHISPGVYSLIEKRWISRDPEPHIVITPEQQEKAKEVEGELQELIDAVEVDPEAAPALERYWRDLRSRRQKSLAANGLSADDNVVFKLLRKTGIMDKLHEALIEAQRATYDLVETTMSGAVGGYSVPLGQIPAGSYPAIKRTKKKKKKA